MFFIVFLFLYRADRVQETSTSHLHVAKPKPWTSHANTICRTVRHPMLASATHHSHTGVASVSSQIDDEALAGTSAATAALEISARVHDTC